MRSVVSINWHAILSGLSLFTISATFFQWHSSFAYHLYLNKKYFIKLCFLLLIIIFYSSQVLYIRQALSSIGMKEIILILIQFIIHPYLSLMFFVMTNLWKKNDTSRDISSKIKMLNARKTNSLCRDSLAFTIDNEFIKYFNYINDLLCAALHKNYWFQNVRIPARTAERCRKWIRVERQGTVF